MSNSIKTNYEELPDEDLVNLIQQGDSSCQDYLIDKYKNLVKMKSRAYFLTGSDRDDIVQEGMIGLFKAIRDYEMGKASSFYSFAELCISRQIFTAIKTATRKKHFPLNNYISLNRPVYESESATTFADTSLLLGKGSSPETIIIEREDKEYIQRKMGESLSKLEAEVLSLYIQGKSYVEIAELTDRRVKSVDNALQRIKRKVEGYVMEVRG